MNKKDLFNLEKRIEQEKEKFRRLRELELIKADNIIEGYWKFHERTLPTILKQKEEDLREQFEQKLPQFLADIKKRLTEQCRMQVNERLAELKESTFIGDEEEIKM